MKKIDEAEIERLGLEFEKKTPQEIIRFALDKYGNRVSFASSFGAEDVAIIDMITKIKPGVRVFTLETGYLFPETHDVIKRIKEKYNIKLETYAPSTTVEEFERQYGKLYETDPDKCCAIRKIEPLNRAIADNLDAWITGIRRDQSPTRANTKKVEVDKKFNLVKFNPIADWISEKVWNYIRKNNVPYNVLHNKNYPSIGCAPCTKPVKSGEDPRAGRWAGKEKTECGLHTSK
ncbi:MAG TPA: phosphoadenylyl-sulfate reductase [Nitrospinae bacterium]|nr:phosphoadenylyl-sulfate reductase [Nitrospinota bacterium]HBA25857.1 phosphoadenylyl-sulfate reductase [Nitrospinota bacterium]